MSPATALQKPRKTDRQRWTRKQAAILDYIRTHPRCSARDVATALKRPGNSVRDSLVLLAAKGLLIRRYRRVIITKRRIELTIPSGRPLT